MKHQVFPPPDPMQRLFDKGDQLAATKAKLGECIHGLRLAAKAIASLGGDPSIYRELADEANELRWAA